MSIIESRLTSGDAFRCKAGAGFRKFDDSRGASV
jgi:hypothetical protein